MVAFNISSNVVNVSLTTVSWFSVRFCNSVRSMELIRFVLKLLFGSAAGSGTMYSIWVVNPNGMILQLSPN